MRKYTLKIISPDESYIYIHNNIDSVRFEALDRGSTSEVLNWGIFSNRGEVHLFDLDGTVETFLKKNEFGITKVEIYLSSDIFDKKIATFRIDDYIYNTETKEVTILLKDSLQDWQSIEQGEIYLFDSNTALFVLNKIINSARVDCSARVDWAYDDINTTLQLKFFNIYCPHLPPNNLWANVNKICEITMCRVFENVDGVPTIVRDDYYTDIFTSTPISVNPIIIRPDNIISISNAVSRRNTKISSTTILIKNRKKHLAEEVAPPTPYSIYDYESTTEQASVNGQTITLNKIEWVFVGADKSVNPNVEIEEKQEDDYGYQKSAIVSFRTTAVSNTHQITSYSTLSTQHEETDPINTRWENTAISEVEPQMNFDRDSGEVSVNFKLKDAFYSGRRVVSKAQTKIYGNFYTDDPDIIYNRNSNDESILLSPINIPSNELLQSQNTSNMQDPIPHYQWITNKVFERYGSGVDCCEIECVYGDYFGDDGTKLIDASGIKSAVQGFSKYDVVIPYIQKGDRVVPYKINDQGEPKSFKVIGIKHTYDGVLRQTLCLQEHISNY